MFGTASAAVTPLICFKNVWIYMYWIFLTNIPGVQRGYKALYDTKIIGPLVDRFTATLATSFTFFTGTVAAPGKRITIFPAFNVT